VPLANILNNWWYPLAWKPSTTYFDLKIGNLVYYFSYFLVGVIFYSNEHIFTKLKNSKAILIIGILAVLAFLLRVHSDYSIVGDAHLKDLAQMQFDPIMVICNSLLIGVNTILWCLFFIGLTSKFIHSGSAILRWFVEPEWINFDVNPMKNKHHKMVFTPIKRELQITMMGSNCICARSFKCASPTIE
jgi:putative effector of murein hydrolase